MKFDKTNQLRAIIMARSLALRAALVFKPAQTQPQFFRLLCIGLCVIFLNACAGAAKKEEANKGPEQARLLSTKEYLPVRQYDKEGQVIPFSPQANPYLLQKGKIDKEVVLEFIAARKAIKAKQYDQAKAALEAITQQDKALAGPWVLLGQIALEQKDQDLAKQHFSKAIATNPLNVNAYLPLALIEREQGHFIEAQNIYTQALKVWKDFPEAHLNLAILYDIYLNDALQAQQHMEAYVFLTEEDDAQVNRWLEEIQARTGIAPNLYIGPSNTSQISEGAGDKSES